MHSYGRSRLVSLVCSVCTLSDQLQATAPPGADTAYLWACFNENCLVQSPGNMQCCALLLLKRSRQCTSDLLNILPRSCCTFMTYHMLLSTFSRYCKVYTQHSGDQNGSMATTLTGLVATGGDLLKKLILHPDRTMLNA